MIKQEVTLEGPCTLECGITVENITVAYHISKEAAIAAKAENPKPKRVIWICHALTANSDPTEWWCEMVGEGKLFDPREETIICVNMVGSCYGSWGPTSIAPNGKPYLLSFPEVTVRDMVALQNKLRLQLKIERIDLMVGASIGGFQALEWIVEYNEVVKEALIIACSGVASPWVTAFNESQRMALFADPTFQEQKSSEGGREGLKCARSIALLSYRSYQGYCATQKENSGQFLFSSRAGSYQQYQGEKLANRFDAYSYYTLSRAVDSHNLARGRGSLEEALAKVTAKTVVIGIGSDYLFPFHEQELIANSIKGAVLEKLESNFGHDGFLIEHQQLQTIIQQHLNY